jgi:hypothetical protein
VKGDQLRSGCFEDGYNKAQSDVSGRFACDYNEACCEFLMVTPDGSKPLLKLHYSAMCIDCQMIDSAVHRPLFPVPGEEQEVWVLTEE